MCARSSRTSVPQSSGTNATTASRRALTSLRTLCLAAAIRSMLRLVITPRPANSGATRCAASTGLVGYVSCERNAARPRTLASSSRQLEQLAARDARSTHASRRKLCATGRCGRTLKFGSGGCDSFARQQRYLWRSFQLERQSRFAPPTRANKLDASVRCRARAASCGRIS